MKMVITEKQLSIILGGKEEIDEADSLASPSTTNNSTSPSTASPTTSTAPASSGVSASSPTSSEPEGRGAMDFPAYPEVGHWESGVSRGPANQISSKSTWSDVVGSKLTRGKANPLK